jgi:hypothetical protein
MYTIGVAAVSAAALKDYTVPAKRDLKQARRINPLS